MNNLVKKAKELNKQNQNFPDLEVGDIVTIKDVWDGRQCLVTDYRNAPYPVGTEISYSYIVTDADFTLAPDVHMYLNYEFEVVESSEKDMDTLIIITNIGFV